VLVPCCNSTKGNHTVGYIKIIAFSLLIASQSLRASAAELPDTPAGNAMGTVLVAFSDNPVPLDPAKFAQSFLDIVPAEQLNSVPPAIKAQFGALQLVSIDKANDTSIIVVCTGAKNGIHLRVSLELDDAGLISGLLLRPAPELDNPDDSWDDILADLQNMGQHVSLLAWQLNDDEPIEIQSLNATAPLAVGSTFKLYVLGTLAQRIDETSTSWTDTLPIQDSLKSFPSGTMQNDPAGTEHTLAQYAKQMISISDNTATDHLINFLGRAPIEAYMSRLNANPDRNKPFLSTSEMFKIKLSNDQSLRDQFARADEPTRRTILRDSVSNAPLPKLEEVAADWVTPRNIDTIEWFMTAKDCAKALLALDSIAQLDGQKPLTTALTTNPGLPLDAKTWTKIIFKGGSEPGVVNLSFLLQRNDNTRFILILTINDQSTNPDLIPFTSVASRAANMLENTK
jgi:beta-lactamase class A